MEPIKKVLRDALTTTPDSTAKENTQSFLTTALEDTGQSWTCRHCGATVQPVELTLFDEPRYITRRWCPCKGSQADRLTEHQADRDYQARQLIVNAGLQAGKLSRFTFNNWDTRRNSPHSAKVLEAIEAYAENVNRSGSNWLYICGPYGLGKTHLAVAALRKLAFDKMWTPHYVLWPAHCAKVQESWNGGGAGPTEGQLWARMRRADILLIDDVDKRDATAWAMGKLYEVIDARYLKERPTILTANHAPRALAEMWDDKRKPEQVRDLGKATLSRIMEQLCGAIEFHGEDQRWERK